VTVWRRVKAGLIEPPFPVGGGKFYWRPNIEAYIARCREGNGKEAIATRRENADD
jgi:hypothetical protein